MRFSFSGNSLAIAPGDELTTYHRK